jgi:hypothetical protein
MTNSPDTLRDQIYKISLRPINDIYYVPPGVEGKIGLTGKQIDKVIALFNSRLDSLVDEVGKKFKGANWGQYDQALDEVIELIRKG